MSTQRINSGPTYNRSALQPHHAGPLQLVTVCSPELIMIMMIIMVMMIMIMMMIMMMIAAPTMRLLALVSR